MVCLPLAMAATPERIRSKAWDEHANLRVLGGVQALFTGSTSQTSVCVCVYVCVCQPVCGSARTAHTHTTQPTHRHKHNPTQEAVHAKKTSVLELSGYIVSG